MSWTAAVPEELKAKATAVIGNIAPEECAQCPKLEWLQTWSAGVDKYQRPGILQAGSMLRVEFTLIGRRTGMQARRGSAVR